MICFNHVLILILVEDSRRLLQNAIELSHSWEVLILILVEDSRRLIVNIDGERDIGRS